MAVIEAPDSVPTPVRTGSGSMDFRAARSPRDHAQRYLSPLPGISVEREENGHSDRVGQETHTMASFR